MCDILVMEGCMQGFDDIEEKIKKHYAEYNRILDLLTYEEVLLDKKLFLHLEKERNRLESIALAYGEYLKLIQTQCDIKEMLGELSHSDRLDIEKEEKLVATSISEIKEKLVKLNTTLDAQKELITIEISSDKNELSTMLRDDLFMAYTLFVENNNLSIKSTIDKNIMVIEGLNAIEYFSGERAVHIATKDKESAVCRVFVYDGVDNDFHFDIDDVEIVATRSSGAGGQHINTTDSAIRATHIPTKISVYAQEERSQLQNKENAIARLKDKVVAHYNNEYKKKCDTLRKEQLKDMKDNDTKVYDYNERVVTDKFGKKIDLRDFLKGKLI